MCPVQPARATSGSPVFENGSHWLGPWGYRYGGGPIEITPRTAIERALAHVSLASIDPKFLLQTGG